MLRIKSLDQKGISLSIYFNKFSSCSICLEKYKNSDLILEFNCKEHFFHKDCLKEWIKKSEYCPLCKHDLLSEYRNEEEEEEEDDIEIM